MSVLEGTLFSTNSSSLGNLAFAEHLLDWFERAGEAHSLPKCDAYRPYPPVLGLEEQRPQEPAPHPFEREIAVSLLGLETPQGDWQDRAFDHLAEKCAYLIHVRGYEAWVM